MPPEDAATKSILLTPDQLSAIGPVEPGQTITLTAGESTPDGQTFDVTIGEEGGLEGEVPMDEPDPELEDDPEVTKALGYDRGKLPGRKKEAPNLSAKDLEED